ncbi:MAG: triose-phosphate isomerase [bacterium]|nr:triose-phosphate isomerase [bacterium]
MRRPIIAGNWKMNKLPSETRGFVESLVKLLSDAHDRDILLMPPFVSLSLVVDACQGSNIKVGAQNIYFEKEGAWTGEVSADMLKNIGAEYSIIGHSERRQYFKETDEMINKKLKRAVSVGLTPIFCLGEREVERKKGIERDVVYQQLTRGLLGVELEKIVIAYEPVWAIGTGKTATPQDAEEMHLFIRESLQKIYNKELAESVRIQYGGSVKPDNIDSLMAQPDIDGALVGGASLNIDSFVRIVRFK